MVKLNKKKGRRSGKRIQYNLARKSLKKKSKKKSKSKKILIGGYLPKSNEYDDKATISFDINNCYNQTQSVKITFKSHGEKKLNSDDSRNFVLLKHRVLDEKTSTPLMKTPLYEAYFKIPKIIFSLCKQKSKGDKNNLKLIVKYDKTGKHNSFDISHNCTPSKFGSMNNMVKTQVETDASGVKDEFKNALKNHTSYNDQISPFLTSKGKNLSDKTIEKIKRKYNVKHEEKEEEEEKETETEKEKHIVKEECDETKQLLKGMTITINPDGTVQFNKSGDNSAQSMNKVVNNIAMSLQNSHVIVDPYDSNEQDATETSVTNLVNQGVQTTGQKEEELIDSEVQTTSQASQASKESKDEYVIDAQAQESKDEEVKAAEDNVKAEAKKAVKQKIGSTSSNEENVEKDVKDTAEKKVTEELLKVAAIKAVEQLQNKL